MRRAGSVIPAKAGIQRAAGKRLIPAPPVIPAKAGIQKAAGKRLIPAPPVIPAKAGIQKARFFVRIRIWRILGFSGFWFA